MQKHCAVAVDFTKSNSTTTKDEGSARFFRKKKRFIILKLVILSIEFFGSYHVLLPPLECEGGHSVKHRAVCLHIISSVWYVAFGKVQSYLLPYFFSESSATGHAKQVDDRC